MGKYIKLLKNVSILTVSNLSSKILSILLIPLYTNVLSTGDYGTFDLYQTTVDLLIPILSLNIPDAVLRFSLDKSYDKHKVFTIGLQKEFIGSLILCIIIVLNAIFNIIPIFNQYPIVLFAMFVLVLLHTQLTQFAQGCEKILHLGIAGILSSVILLSSNLLMLLVFKMGLLGYFYSFCISYIIPIVYLLITLNVKNNIILKCNDKKLSKAMTSYSKPLMVNTLAWWVTNVSDRYIVTLMCGVTANGIYSVSYKIPAILNAFQTIFNQAWTISVVEAYKEKDYKFFSKIYEIYNALMVIICSVLIVATKLFAKILFAKEFYTAWKYSGFLLISVVFSSLSIVLAGVFSASKDTSQSAKTTAVGTAVNIILNIILINKIGAIGAAIATLVAYLVIWIIRLILINKSFKLKINLFRDIVSYITLVVQTCVLFVSNNVILYVAEIILFLFILLIYKNNILSYIKTLKEKVAQRRDDNKI